LKKRGTKLSKRSPAFPAPKNEPGKANKETPREERKGIRVNLDINYEKQKRPRIITINSPLGNGTTPRKRGKNAIEKDLKEKKKAFVNPRPGRETQKKHKKG